MDAHGLRELYDLVLRLSAVHDLDAPAQEVVDHARRLLGVDVAYLAWRNWTARSSRQLSTAHRLRGSPIRPRGTRTSVSGR
jgi:hypothetical protein